MSAAQTNSSSASLAAAAEVGEQAIALLRPDIPPREYVELLMARELFSDAVRFLAHALPRRECVWWGWVCARRAAGENPPPKIRAALEAAEKWIAQPAEENRRAAKAAADAAGLDSAAGCAALGAFFSGGSLAPPDAPVAPPGPYLTAKAIGGAVVLAAVAREPEKAPEKFRASLAQGLEITQKIKLWP